jgi:hypothetical protein
MEIAPISLRNVSTSWLKTDERVHVKTTWTRRSDSKRATASRRRVAEVMLCTMARTVRWAWRLTQSKACGPMGTLSHSLVIVLRLSSAEVRRLKL